MKTHLRKITAALLCLLMLVNLLPTAAQGNSGSPTGQPSGENTLHIQVFIQSAENPGEFVPAENIWVSYKHYALFDSPRGAFTDASGSLTLANVPDGLSLVYLETDEEHFPFAQGYQFPPGYVEDAQSTYVLMGIENRESSLTFYIKRIPEGQTTGGIRLQKAYYPYPISLEMQTGALKELMVYQGEEVAGAQFVVFTKDNFGDYEEAKRYWFQGDEFVDEISEAAIFTSDDTGQVLIEGLPEGRYMLEEVKYLPGTTGFDGPDYGYNLSDEWTQT